MPKSVEDILQGFEQIGEQAVWQKLAGSRYDEREGQLAARWLQRKDQERTDASVSEQTEIARSAKDAAWVSAEAAKAANKRATYAVIISAVSAIAAIFALFLNGA
jgi:hypothetical protein